MRTLRTVVELARADFLERTRRYGFLVALGAVAYLAYTVYAGWWTVRIGSYFAVPGPAWTGTLMAVVTSVTLSLVGFYVVSGTVERDRRTRVGPILAATRASRLQYAAGKLLSSLAVLGSMVLVLVILAVVMALTRGEGLTPGEAWSVVSPFLLLVVPMLGAVAGVAVLFDSVPWFRGTGGTVAYFFLWVGILSFAGFDTARHWADVTGIALLFETLKEGLLSVHPGASIEGLSVQIRPPTPDRIGEIPWTGIGWSLEHVARRFLWLAVGVGLTGPAALCLRLFDPFGDPSPRGGGKNEKSPAPSPEGALPRPGEATAQGSRAPSSPPSFGAPETLRSPSLRPVGPASFLRFLLGESRLLLRGHAWWWYTLLAGANLAALLVPAESVSWTLLVAWLIPIAAWSSLGCRERLRGTEALLFSTSGPRLRQLPVQWAAGTILSLATAVGPLIRLAATGDLPSLLTLGVGAAFVPALALCLGTWSGSRKLFEALYLALWYVGPLNEVPALDYMGVTGIALETGATSAFAAATLLLFALAWIGRGRRLQAD